MQLIPPRDTMANHEEDHHYQPQDALSGAIKATMLTGGVGLCASAVQNALAKQNVGPLGIFMRSGGTITLFGTGSLLDRFLCVSMLTQMFV